MTGNDDRIVFIQNMNPSRNGKLCISKSRNRYKRRSYDLPYQKYDRCCYLQPDGYENLQQVVLSLISSFEQTVCLT